MMDIQVLVLVPSLASVAVSGQYPYMFGAHPRPTTLPADSCSSSSKRVSVSASGEYHGRFSELLPNFPLALSLIRFFFSHNSTIMSDNGEAPVAPKEDTFMLTVRDPVRDGRAAPSSTPPCVDVWFARAMR